LKEKPGRLLAQERAPAIRILLKRSAWTTKSSGEWRKLRALGPWKGGNCRRFAGCDSPSRYFKDRFKKAGLRKKKSHEIVKTRRQTRPLSQASRNRRIPKPATRGSGSPSGKGKEPHSGFDQESTKMPKRNENKKGKGLNSVLTTRSTKVVRRLRKKLRRPEGTRKNPTGRPNGKPRRANSREPSPQEKPGRPAELAEVFPSSVDPPLEERKKKSWPSKSEHNNEGGYT